MSENPLLPPQGKTVAFSDTSAGRAALAAYLRERFGDVVEYRMRGGVAELRAPMPK